jgi:erythromycin esterase-like protein
MVAFRRERPEAIVREAARPLSGSSRDYDDLIRAIGDAQVVLIGEASHGTHEFYDERARITRRLIEEKGFTAVCVEADWPDAYRINRFVRGAGDDPDALAALGDFQRFPAWMWRNQDVLEFVEWLSEHNGHLPNGSPHAVGFYGLDLYSLHASIRAVIAYLETIDKEAARRARARYACFEHFGEDPQAYGFAASYRIDNSCEDNVVRQLEDLRNKSVEYSKKDGKIAEDEYFFAEQNARLALHAERYYRTMFAGRVTSWNLRDTHMTETLDALIEHLGRRGERPKVVVWAHNSHLGDARATEVGRQGEHNVGQLVRERCGDKAYDIGFTTYTGTVTAADDWDEPPRRMAVRPGLDGSYEDLFHRVELPRFWLDLRSGGPAAEGLRKERLERAIGVVYRPRTERVSHYFGCRLSDQFDAVIHIDETSALVPLDRPEGWHAGEVPETFPTGV